MKSRSFALAAAISLTLAGCAAGPDYKRPNAPVASQYKELPPGWKLSQPDDAHDRGPWWAIYQDPELDALEKQIDVSNQNLQASAAAYLLARALAEEAGAALYPTLSLNAGATRQRNSAATATGGAITTVVPNVQGSRTVNLSSSWDLDLWGKLRREKESAVASAQASAADLASARLSAQASLAIDYFNLRAADELEKLLDATVAAYAETLRITQNQYSVGVVSRLDVITATNQWQQAKAEQINAGVTRAQLEHAIAVLVGKTPDQLDVPKGGLTQEVPVIPVTVPSALLERRPDIASAERQMAAQNAQIGAAEASYFPSITLSALLGYASSPMAALISAPNRAWSAGVQGSELLFDAGNRSGQMTAAEASYQESVANYRQAVLSAFQGVEDQLSNLRILADEAQEEDQAVQSAQQAVQIALNQYRAGIVTFTTVVTEQTALLSAQQQALTVRQNRIVASVTLIEDLGGGWDASQLPSDSQASDTSSDSR